MFGALFNLLGARHASFATLLPGVVLAAVCRAGLQLGGGYFVSHEVRGATPANGTFALVLGLLVWVHLGAMLTVFSDEHQRIHVDFDREV